MLRVLMLRFVTWVIYQSGSSQKIETTLVISNRGNVMPKIDYLMMEELRSQTDSKEPLLYLGRRDSGKGGITRTPVAMVISWN